MKMETPIPTQLYQQKTHPAIFPDFLFSPPGGEKKKTAENFPKKYGSPTEQKYPQAATAYQADLEGHRLADDFESHLRLGEQGTHGRSDRRMVVVGFRTRSPPGLFCPDGNAEIRYSVSDGENPKFVFQIDVQVTMGHQWEQFLKGRVTVVLAKNG